MAFDVRQALQQGLAIPAHPLALTADRKLAERRQRALTRYYAAAGAGGVAVGVHTTQFAIRKVGLFEPVLALAQEELNRLDLGRKQPMVRIGGICGPTSQAVCEAGILRDLGYHAGLLSLAALQTAKHDALLEHCREIASVLPVIGFYLQPAAGGRTLCYEFWRKFLEIENVVAIKVAPFNRYQTIDVVRAVAESGRRIALYTGNDDNIVADLLTPYRFLVDGETRDLRIVGGLLGHWAVWTQSACRLLSECHAVIRSCEEISPALLRRGIEVTDANAAFFDPAHQFRGCIAGIHEVLRRQGLLEGIWCLDPEETLSLGQEEEIDRVYRAYPYMNDDIFVRENLDQWLNP
jgi:hypothetical protein